MRDDRLRSALKRLALWNFAIGLSVTRAVGRLRGEPSFALGGSCRRSAACCEEPAIQVGTLVFYLPTLRRLFLWWQERVNGFRLVARDARHRLFVFECTHFDRATRSCDSYASRPGICRDYPRVLLRQASPAFLPGCGYRAIAPNAAGLKRALGRTPLTEEQRRRLNEALGLESDGP